MPYNTKEKKAAHMKKYHVLNRDKILSYAKEYRQKNKAYFAEYGKQYFAKHPESNKAAVQKYLAKKRSEPGWIAHQSAKSHAWNVANRDRLNARTREWRRKRRETDICFVIKNRLRERLRKKLKCQKAHKSTDTMALTGCTGEFLRGYLEARFKPGMTWNNVHIDHIIPCAEFDLRDPDQQRKCFHYTNLQPLFGKDNLSKGRKFPVVHQPEFL